MPKTLAEQLSRFVFESAPIQFELRDSVAKKAGKSRKELLSDVRAGKVVELEDVSIVAYSQGLEVGQNTNLKYIRFQAEALSRIAKTAVGAVFLRDHQERDLMARGGTVTASAFEFDSEKQVYLLRQTLNVVKPWAVEGLLDGTIDRFSIGIRPQGPILYSHTGEEIVGYPRFFPGEVLDDGTVVEWIFTDAVLPETSGVNVPAAGMTGVESIRAQLSAHLGAPDEPQPHTFALSGKKGRPMKKLLALLKLSAEASEQAAVDAVTKLQADLADADKAKTDLQTKLETEQAKSSKLEAELATIDKERKEQAQAQSARELDAAVSKLYDESKLVKVRDGEGEKPDPMEEPLRKLWAIEGGRELFAKQAEALRPQHKLTATPQTTEIQRRAEQQRLQSPEPAKVPAWKKPLEASKGQIGA